MELIRCHVENFGRLSDLNLEFHAGLNAFCLENGGGKTTLCAFIKCMLYGLADNRKQSLYENERKHYLPWQGGIFGGSLTVLHEGRVYRISRRFGARPSEDSLEVFDEETGAKTDALGSCPGRSMLSIDAEGFRDCAAFSERAFAPTLENESVFSLMGAQKNEGEVSLSAALDRLAEQRREYERRGGRGLLFEIDAEIARDTARQAALLPSADALSEKEADFLEAKAALSAVRAAPNDTPRGTKKRNRALLFAVFATVLCTLALLGTVLSPLSLLLLIPAAALFLLPLCIRDPKYARQASAEEGNGDPSSDFEEKYRICAERQRAYEAALNAHREVAFLAEQLRRLREQRAQIEQRLSDIKKTETLLAEAGRRYREARGKATLSHFKAHLLALGEKGGEDFRLDDRFSPSLLSADAYRSAEALSRAGKDAVSLSRSLALLCAMPTAAKPPLILDDPFLAYDDGRLAGALGLLDALGKEFQILYFTCSHSRMP